MAPDAAQPAHPLPFDLSPPSPVVALRRLAELDPVFLLESSTACRTALGRYSFLGLGAALRVEVFADARGQRVEVDGVSRPTPDPEALLDALREARDRAPRLLPEVPGFHLPGGLVGAAGFELVRCFEPRLGAPRSEGPLARYLAPRSLLAIDNHLGRAALLHAGPEAERQALLARVRALLARPAAPLPAGVTGPLRASFGDAAFLEAVRRTQDHIRAGEVFQLVLSSRFEGPSTVHPLAAYAALRELNPSPYLYYLDLGDQQVVGSSPEALVRLHGEVATLRPIAGTRPRGADAAADTALEAELRADVKEAAEHVMLVDLARNDLGRVAEPGSVAVGPFRTVERYSHVMHLVSGVQGRLRAGRDGLDLFRAAFPAGTVSGAPKVRALELIEELEPVARGLYSGTVGYFGATGDLDQALTIRTLVFEGGRVSVQAGAGIVARSRPEAELAEVRAKARGLLRALELAEARGEVAA